MLYSLLQCEFITFLMAVFDIDLICWSSTYTFILLNVLVTCSDVYIELAHHYCCITCIHNMNA